MKKKGGGDRELPETNEVQITSYEETGNTFHNDDHLRAGQSGDFKLVACWAVSHELSVAKFDKTLIVYSGCLTLSYLLYSEP